MVSTPATIPIRQYIAIDLHKYYVTVGGQNAQRAWTLRPRDVWMTRFRGWAAKNLRPGDAVVLETTSNVWDIYDIVAPLVTKTLVAHFAQWFRPVRFYDEGRVMTKRVSSGKNSRNPVL